LAAALPKCLLQQLLASLHNPNSLHCWNWRNTIILHTNKIAKHHWMNSR
jgi:hypothetical protein